MDKDVLLVIDVLSNEKNVDKELIFEAMEAALASATKRGITEDIDVRVHVNRETGAYDTFRRWTVVADDIEESEDFDEEIGLGVRVLKLTEAREQQVDLEVDDVIEEEMPSIKFGRIAAQKAKQVIMQKVREAERARIIGVYRERMGELINGTVKRVTRDNVFIDLGGNAEAILPRDNTIANEAMRTNDRVRAVLSEIREDAKGGAQLVLDRISPQMLIELFKIEVPEIGEELIEIRGAAREPGARAKIAVKTNDGRIDPVGACVGMRGSRVQTVSSELGGERIDIVLWDDNPAQLVINAISPAEVSSIMVDEESNTIDIAVTEDQLSQAIGRGGQNIRLASELTGWKLNVMTSEQAEEKSEEEAKSTLDLFIEKLDIDEEMAEILVEEGFTSIEDIAYVPEAEMLDIDGFDEELVSALKERAKDVLLTQALADEEAAEQPAEDLLGMDGMTPELARTLAKNGVITMEDLAEQSVDELTDIDGIEEEQAGELIMTARKPWFEEE